MKTNHRAERGIALFVSIFALLLLSAVAMGLMYLADTETNINYNYRASQQAVAAAHAGLQEVRERMVLAHVAPHLITPPMNAPSTASAGSVMYVLNGAGVDPTNAANQFFDTELCQENFLLLGVANPGPGVRCTTPPMGAGWANTAVTSDAPMAGTANAMSWRWVRLTWKLNNSTGYFVNPATPANQPVCWDGVRQIPLPAGLPTCESPDPGTTVAPPRSTVYMLTALAQTQSGARRMVQMEVAQDPPMVTNAAVDSQDHVDLSGSLKVNGYDNCSCKCTTTKVGGKDVTTCVDRVMKDGTVKTCDKTKFAIYSAGEIDPPSSSEVIIAGTGTPEGSQPTAENQPWTYDIDAQIERYKPYGVNATDACFAGGPQPCGWSCPAKDCGTHSGTVAGIPPLMPIADPDDLQINPALGPMQTQVTYIPGTAHLTSGFVGNGVLVVDGDLEINGGAQFYGLILVRGVVSFTGGGADPRNIYGSILAGQQSKVNVDTVLGGSVDIQFDYCALPKNDRNKPPVLISSRELSF